MTSAQIRQQFLDFFASKGHQIVPSAPLVIKNDPTLMFTNAGMNQFKDYFLGNKQAPTPRIADTQKCLRVSGKHNDLEEVGLDTYHHTMFEMLGNWSFGDYFKKDALEWSWELLTEVFKLPKERLYVSVFGGDDKENLAIDEDARAIWRSMVADDHILLGSKKDNFWEMGDTGPCGPCSEIHIDLRPQHEVDAVPGRDLVNNDHPQVVEIWNNVFMEFNRLADGSLQKLPAQHVDTGMGFERLCMAIQGKTSNYDTDVFQPTIQFIAAKSGIAYGGTMEKPDVAMRVISDHIRAIAFTIADGQLPSNNKAGYVIRRILRRAVRYYFNFLGFKEPFLHTLVPLLAQQFKDVFPELAAQQDFVAKVIEEEEIAFLRTLDTGLKRLNTLLATHEASKVIPGPEAFELFDTYGFPLDLTSLIAREQGYSVDEVGFQASMLQQKERSRAATAVETGDWVYLEDASATTFIGYDELSCRAKVVRWRQVSAKGKSLFQLVLDRTPFFGESGGQVGDKGKLTLADGQVIAIFDTKKENDLIVHMSDSPLVKELSADNNQVTAEVNATLRLATSSNHTATHLLHAALKQVVGTHVNQKGSLVSPDVLRFDFSHFSKVEDNQLDAIEAMVNEKILANIPLIEERDVPLQEAIDRGAMALFGEKYGERVRVITYEPGFSTELCGGTHVSATGQIGLVKVVAESSVAAGVRRIEALTGKAALDYLNDKANALDTVKSHLRTTGDVLKAVEQLLEERSRLQKELEAIQAKQLKALAKELIADAAEKGGSYVLVREVEVPSADALKQLVFDLKALQPNGIYALAANIADKPSLAVIVGDAVPADRGADAGKIIKAMATHVKGGGGGQPHFATAGGKDVAGISAALKEAEHLIG